MIEWLLVAALIVAVILIPPKYDPAVRWKEWLERKK
jgi:hypothetical protein